MTLTINAVVAIRRHWTARSSRAAKSIAGLKALGYNVSCYANWPILVTGLSAAYPNPGAAVVAVASCVEACCKALASLIREDGDEEMDKLWNERFKELCSGSFVLQLRVENSESLEMFWDDRGFTILIPGSRALDKTSALIQLMRSQALDTFVAESSDEEFVSDTETFDLVDAMDTPPEEADAEEMEDAEPGEIGDAQASQADDAAAPEQAETEAIPDAGTSETHDDASAGQQAAKDTRVVSKMVKEEELMHQPPYHLTFRLVSRKRAGHAIEVQCNNPQCLDYIRLFLRGVHDNYEQPDDLDEHVRSLVLCDAFRSPFADVENCLIIYTPYENHLGFRIKDSLPLFFNLVEGVMGFTSVWISGRYWQYRRDAPLTFSLDLDQ